jgi:hypothetical protein
MKGLKALLKPCEENTVRDILVKMCSMFQRDYLNDTKLYQNGALLLDHVKEIVKNALIQEGLAKQRLAGGSRHKGIFVVDAVPNLFRGQPPDTIAHLNSLVQRCGKEALKNTVLRLCASLQKNTFACIHVIWEGLDDIETLHIDSVRDAAHDARTAETHALILQQDADRCAFAVVRGARPQRQGHVKQQMLHQAAKADGRKQVWTGLLSVSADVLALVASYLAREKVRCQREWKVGHECSIYSPCGNFVLTHSESEDDTRPDRSCLKLFHATSGRFKFSLHGHTDPVNSCCISPDGKAIVSVSADTTVKVWNAESGSLMMTLEGHDGKVYSVDISHDSTRILSLGDGDIDTAKLWNANTGEIQHTLHFDEAHGTCCSFSPNSTTFLVGVEPLGDGAYELKLYNAKTYELQRSFKGHADWICSCSFAHDGATILSGSADSTMKLWCVTTGQLLRTLEGHAHYISSCAFSPSGLAIVSASRDRTLRLWTLSTGQHQIIDADPSQPSCSASFSPDGKSILGSYADGTVKVWSYKEKAGLIQG